MGYAEYFANKNKDIPRPKFDLGTRVFGHFTGVPFIGTVVREHDKQVLVHADLPLKVQQDIHNVMWIPTKDVKQLVEF